MSKYVQIDKDGDIIVHKDKGEIVHPFVPTAFVLGILLAPVTGGYSAIIGTVASCSTIFWSMDVSKWEKLTPEEKADKNIMAFVNQQLRNDAKLK